MCKNERTKFYFLKVKLESVTLVLIATFARKRLDWRKHEPESQFLIFALTLCLREQKQLNKIINKR